VSGFLTPALVVGDYVNVLYCRCGKMLYTPLSQEYNSVRLSWPLAFAISARKVAEMSMLHVAVVWHPGTGAQLWSPALTFAEFKAYEEERREKEGLRLHTFSKLGNRYAAVWRPGSGTQLWQTGMSIDEFDERDAHHFKNGLRLTSLRENDGTFLAVWRPGQGAQHWRTGMSGAQLTTQDQLYFTQGLRLKLLDVDGGKYSAVWSPGSGAQHWHSGISIKQFESKMKEYLEKGLRIATLAVEDGHFTATWRPGSGVEYGLSAVWSEGGEGAVDFLKGEDDRHFYKDGLRVSCMDIFDGPNETVVGIEK
jgi:hypothetical protein